MSWARPLHVAFVLGAVATLPAPAAAQRTTKVIADPDCSNCTIELTRSFTIGGIDDSSQLAQPNGAALNSKGELLLSHIAAPNQVFVYDNAGRFLRAIGRAGNGPGEFRLVRSLRIGRGDTLYVFDNGVPRISVFDNTHTFVRAIPALLNSNDFIRLQSGEFVMNAIRRTPKEVGYPLHMVDSSGITRSFGTQKPEFRRDLASLLNRRLAVGSDGALWAAHETAYQIEMLDSSGRVTQRFVRDVDWFEPHASSPRIEADKPPAPRIHDFRVDENGFLWVLIRVADPKWKDALKPQGRLQGRTYLGYTTPDAYFDSIVEVIDPRTGKLVASGRSPEAILFLLGHGAALSYRESDSVPYVDFWRVSTQLQTGR